MKYVYLKHFSTNVWQMNIAIIGYGKMGKTIHAIANENNDKVVLIIDQENADDIQKVNAKTVDVAIEFSNPESAYLNIKSCLENGVPVVSGTTGWLHRYDEIKEICQKNKGAFMYASNYSIGVNIFFEVNKFLAEKMSNYREYLVQMEEIHHTEKLDAPSGTAITLAEGIIKHNRNFEKWVNQDIADDKVIPILSKRIDKTPGTHIIAYHSEIDDIEIKHTAHSRAGFAQGAYSAARWLKSKEGVYSIQDMLFG